MSSLRETLRTQLADLKMPGALEALDSVLVRVDGGQLGAPEAISAVLNAQIALRNNRRLEAAMRSSRLPAVKTFQDFDFSFQPSLKREQIESLHSLGFLERRENVIFLGPPGVGKTHLAISLAIAAAQQGWRVYYGTLAELITSLEEAQAAGKLLPRMKTLTHPALLVVDEIVRMPSRSAPLPAPPMKRLASVLFWAVIAAAFIGPGTVTTTASAGAAHGSALLWALVFGTLATVLLQEASARIRRDFVRMMRSSLPVIGGDSAVLAAWHCRHLDYQIRWTG